MEAAENAVEAYQITGAAKVAETPGAKEAAENAVEASQIIGAAKVAETLEAARLASKIAMK